MNKMYFKYRKYSGVAAAAILSTSIGSFAIGVCTLLASMSVSIKSFLTWWDPAGSLTGKTSMGIGVWLLSWIVLHFMWRKKNPNMKWVLIFSWIFIFFALFALFPPVFESLKS